MPLVLSALCIGLLFFFMIVRPQKRNLAKHKEMLEQLAAGTEIITSGGIYGTIKSIDDDSVEIEVADNCVIRVAKRSIAMKKVTSADSSVASTESA